MSTAYLLVNQMSAHAPQLIQEHRHAQLVQLEYVVMAFQEILLEKLAILQDLHVIRSAMFVLTVHLIQEPYIAL